MDKLLDSLNQAIIGTPLIAIGAALLWGILSVVLSPCHLSSIPLVVGFINGSGKMTVRRAFGLSTTFSAGILVTIAVIGVITAKLGGMWGDLGPYPNYIIGALLVLVGLTLVGVIPMPSTKAPSFGISKRGYAGAFLMGLVFGSALGPCTFGFMAPMLAVVLEAAKSKLGYALTLLGAFAIGHCVVIALAGTFVQTVQTYLNWTSSSKGASVMRRICGVLVVAGGIYLIRNVAG